MFSRTSILRNLTTNALGPKTSRKLDPGNDRRTRLGGLWRIANRDPELFPLYIVTAATLAWAGWRFVEYPTGGASESHVEIVPDSEPWKDEQGIASQSQYKYHPYNDTRRPVKKSPSALNVVVIPDVTLPKSLHDRYNKWEKPEFNLYTQDNAAAPPNWKQDSKAQSRNALTGELPPSTLDS